MAVITLFMTHPLRIWLDKNGVTQKDFAERVGITKMTLWRILNREGGHRLSTLRRIVNETGGEVKFTDLVEWADA